MTNLIQIWLCPDKKFKWIRQTIKIIIITITITIITITVTITITIIIIVIKPHMKWKGNKERKNTYLGSWGYDFIIFFSSIVYTSIINIIYTLIIIIICTLIINIIFIFIITKIFIFVINIIFIFLINDRIKVSLTWINSSPYGKWTKILNKYQQVVTYCHKKSLDHSLQLSCNHAPQGWFENI